MRSAYELSEGIDWHQTINADHPSSSHVRGLWIPVSASRGNTFYDLSTARRSGSLTNGPAWGVADRALADNSQCLRLTASSSQYVSCPSDNATTQVTAGAWVRADSFASNRGIIAKYNGSGVAKRSWALFVNSSGKPGVALSSTGSYQSANDTLSGTAISIGEWSFVSFTYDSVSGTQIYIDGEQVGSNATSPSSLYQSDQAIWIGAQFSISTVNCWDGDIQAAVVANTYCSAHAHRQLAKRRGGLDALVSTIDRTRARGFVAAVGGSSKPFFFRRNVLGRGTAS